MFSGKVRRPDVEALATLTRVALPLFSEMTERDLHERITGNRRLNEKLRAAFGLGDKPELTLVHRVWLTTEHAYSAQQSLGNFFSERRKAEFIANVAADQPATDITSVSVSRADNPQTILSMCRTALQLSLDARTDEVMRSLKGRRHLLTLRQINQLVERQFKFLQKEEGGEDVGLLVNDWDGSNLFLAEDNLGLVCCIEVLHAEEDRRGQVSCRFRDLSYGRDWSINTRLVLNDSPIVIKQ